MEPALPELALRDWEPTYLKLHRWTQVVGKVCLALAPPLSRWWHSALEVSPQGLRSPLMWHDGRAFTLVFDVCDHRLVGQCAAARRGAWDVAALAR